MCPDVLSLFSIKHQGIFLLEVKYMVRQKKASSKNIHSLLKKGNGDWLQREFYNFICYDKNIYNKYIKNVNNSVNIQTLRIKDISENDINKYKNIIKEYIQSSTTAERYKNYSLACQEVVSSIGFNESQNGKSINADAKQFFANNSAIQGEEALIKYIINVFGKHNIDISHNKEMINDLKSIAAKAGTEVKKDKYYNFKLGLNGLASNYITFHTEQFKKNWNGNINIYSTGAVTYGSSSLSSNLSQRKKTSIQKLENFLNRSSLKSPVSGLNAHEQKIDDLIEIKNNGETLTFSVSIKSHWSKLGSGQKLSIQGSAQTFKNLFNLSAFYGVFFIHDTGYWKFLNDALYQRTNALLNQIESVIYSAYFGNVNYLVEWELQQQDSEVVPDVKIYTKQEILNKIRGQYKFQSYNKVNLWQNFSDNDISPNEEIVLNNVVVAALNSITLSI